MCRQNSIPRDFSPTKQRLLKITIAPLFFCVILSPYFLLFCFPSSSFLCCSSSCCFLLLCCKRFTLDLMKGQNLDKWVKINIFLFFWSCGFVGFCMWGSLYLSYETLGRPSLFTHVWVTDSAHSWLLSRWRRATSLLSSPLSSPLLSHNVSLVAVASNSVPSLSLGCPSTLASCCLPACCLPSAPPALSSAHGPPPSLTLPPPLLLNSSRSLTLCLPPLFPACLPTEDCDCEGYFNGQYIGESVHIFLQLLLLICSLPAAAWLCAGSLGAFGLGVKMTACRVDLSGAGVEG